MTVAELIEELKKYSEEKGQTMTMALERILQEYLREKVLREKNR